MHLWTLMPNQKRMSGQCKKKEKKKTNETSRCGIAAAGWEALASGDVLD